MAKRTKKLRPHRFVVGYRGDANVVYGKDDDKGHSCWSDPLTELQARRKVKWLCEGAVIFELVEVPS